MCPVCLATITTQLIAGATSTGDVAVLIAGLALGWAARSELY